MKFNWKANWEILLVLVIIVVGIVITTIAAIRNKDKPLLPLAEETDFSQLLAGGAGFSETTVPTPQQTAPDEQLPNNSGQTVADDGNPLQVSTRKPHATQSPKSWRPSTAFQPVVKLQNGNNQRIASSNHRYQQDSRQSKYDDNAADFTRTVDQPQQQLAAAAAGGANLNGGSSSSQQDSYEPMQSSTEQPSVGPPNHNEPNYSHSSATMRVRNQRHYQGAKQRRFANKTTPTIHLTGAPNFDGVDNDSGSGSSTGSPYGGRLPGESGDLNDDIHTTHSSLAAAAAAAAANNNNDSNSNNNMNSNGYLSSNRNLAQIPAAQFDSHLSSLMGPSIALHGHYGVTPASMNPLGRLLMQNARTKMEPTSATAGGSLILDTDDMMTSYTRMPSTTNNSLADPLVRDYNLALNALNSSSSHDDSTTVAAIMNSLNQQQQQHSAANRPHRAYSSPLPISMLLNDLLKFARPHSQLSDQQGNDNSQRSILQQLKLLPAPLLASIQAMSSGGSSSNNNNGEQPSTTLPNHDVSESSQHYHKVSMLPTEIHSILARSLRTSGVLPAFPAPKDAPQVWISPTSGGDPAYHEAQNSDADFVASNAAGFVRTSMAMPSEQNSYQSQKPQQQQEAQQLQQQQHNSFMRQQANNEVPAQSYQQQVSMSDRNQNHLLQQQQQMMNQYGQMELAPVDQQLQFQQAVQMQTEQQQQQTPVYPSPRGMHAISMINVQGQNWALDQNNNHNTAYSNTLGPQAKQTGLQSNVPVSIGTESHLDQLENTRRVFKPTLLHTKQQQQQQQQQLDFSNYNNYRKIQQVQSLTQDPTGQQVIIQSPLNLMLAGSNIDTGTTQSLSSGEHTQQYNKQKHHHKYDQSQASSNEILVPLGYSQATAAQSMQPTQQQVNSATIVQNGMQQSRAQFEFGLTPRESKVSFTSTAPAANLKISAPVAGVGTTSGVQTTLVRQQLVQSQQQAPTEAKGLTRRKRAILTSPRGSESGGRVDEIMSGKYGSNEVEEEDDSDSKPLSVVRPDGRPTNSGRVREIALSKQYQQQRELENDSVDADRQTAQSQRSANHLAKKAPHYASLLAYDDHDQQQQDNVKLSGDVSLRSTLANYDEDCSSGERVKNRLRGEPKVHQGNLVPRVVAESIYNEAKRRALDAAGSGLMSRLLGTASTTDEFEDDPDEGDDESANEKRKEELEDVEFGLANSAGRRNRGSQREKPNLSVPNRSSQLATSKHLHQPADKGGGGGQASGSGSNGDPASYSRRHQQRADIEFYGHPGEETRQLKYGILGSGNYEVVNGGVYPEADESTAALNSVANYVRKPGLLGKLLSGEHHQTVGPQAALIAAGGRINGGFLRGASGDVGGGGPIETDLAGYVPAAELAKDLSGPLLELIDVNGGHLLDPSLLAQLGGSGSSAQTTHTSEDDSDEDSARLTYGKDMKLNASKSVTAERSRNSSSNQRYLERKRKVDKPKTEEQQNEIETTGANRDDERPMKFSSSNRMPTTDSELVAVGNNGLDAVNGNQVQQHQESSISGSRLNHGTNQFNSYQILPSKKVTIFSDQDLDSAPSEYS